MPPLRGTWRTYTTADGLAGMRVEDIVEDRDGFLWFATSSNGFTIWNFGLTGDLQSSDSKWR